MRHGLPRLADVSETLRAFLTLHIVALYLVAYIGGGGQAFFNAAATAASATR
jgi:hypothetical protein